MTTKPGDSANFCELDRLLARMRAGDRGAAALFLSRYGSRIRRRVRSRISRIRRVYDSEEILSTTGRRLDQVVRRGHLRAASERQLWSLIFRIAEHAVADKARTFRRWRDAERGSEPERRFETAHRRRADREGDDPEHALQRALELLGDPVDRAVLRDRHLGKDHATIAGRTGLTAAAVRKRWERIRVRLRVCLAPELRA